MVLVPTTTQAFGTLTAHPMSILPLHPTQAKSGKSMPVAPISHGKPTKAAVVPLSAEPKAMAPVAVTTVSMRYLNLGLALQVAT